jgi:hypothetical protein
MSRTSTLPKRLQPMLATLTDAPFDDPGWVFEDKYDGFRMIAEIRRGQGCALHPQRQDHQPQLYRGRQSAGGREGRRRDRR